MISSFLKWVKKGSKIVYSSFVKHVAFKIYNVSVCWRIDIKYTRLLFHYTSQSHHIPSWERAKYKLVMHVCIRTETAEQQWSNSMTQTLTCLTGTCVWCESNKWHVNGFVCVVFVFCRRLMRLVRFSDDPECILKSRHTWKWHYNGIINPLFQKYMRILSSKQILRNLQYIRRIVC